MTNIVNANRTGFMASFSCHKPSLELLSNLVYEHQAASLPD